VTPSVTLHTVKPCDLPAFKRRLREELSQAARELFPDFADTALTEGDVDGALGAPGAEALQIWCDGSWPTGRASVEGSWCLSDGRGWMLTGWQEAGGLWCLLNPEHDGAYGAMLAGWQQVGGRWYWMDKDGAMATGWREVEGKWYFFDAGGAMLERGFARHGDAWYALGPGGAMVEGGALSVGEDGRIAFGG